MSGGALHLLLSYPRKWINSNKKQSISGGRGFGGATVFFLYMYNNHRSSFTTFSPAFQDYIIALRLRLEDKQQGDAWSQINVSMSVKPGRFVNL